MIKRLGPRRMIMVMELETFIITRMVAKMVMINIVLKVEKTKG